MGHTKAMKTLPEILENYKEYVTGVYQGIYDYDESVAIHTIAKELMGCLPEKITDKPTDPFWKDEMSSNAKMTGYNQALDEVRARLTAFIGRDTDENS